MVRRPPGKAVRRKEANVPMPFFMDGPCKDPAYEATRDLPRAAVYKQFVEELWARFEPLADRHCREDARDHFLQRFWEMYLGVTLLDHGFKLHRNGHEGPEYYAIVDSRRMWFEAIAPGGGDGPDRVPELEPANSPGEIRAGYVPTEQIILRYTNALAEKRDRYNDALSKEIVSPDDYYVLALNCSGIPHARFGGSPPYFLQAFLPIGPITITVDVETFEAKESSHAYRPEIVKFKGSKVSTRAFLDEDARFCSCVLHSAVHCVNNTARLGFDFSVLHNPRAYRPIDAAVFGWCEQFTVQDDYLHRSPAPASLNVDTN
jgi:hypothetical protein